MIHFLISTAHFLTFVSSVRWQFSVFLYVHPLHHRSIYLNNIFHIFYRDDFFILFIKIKDIFFAHKYDHFMALLRADPLSNNRSKLFSRCCLHGIQYRHMPVHQLYINISLSISFRCFGCAQRLYDLLHLHCKDQSVRISIYRLYQFFVFFPVQHFRKVVRSCNRPSHPSVLHPHCNHRAVLVFLYSHVFVQDSLRRLRYAYSLPVIGQ